jgi:diguanylate cyclase (GGDEF)-like protein
MAQIWAEHRDQVIERLLFLERAAVLLEAGPLDADVRDQAERHAHSLAGTCGTFGFPRSSEIARLVERRLPSSETGDWMVRAVAELRQDLELPPSIPEVVLGRSQEIPAGRVLLVVDQDPSTIEAIAEIGSQRGLRCITASTPQEATDLLGATGSLHAAVLAWEPGVQGKKMLQLVARLAGMSPPVSVLVLTESGAFADRIEVARLGAQRFLPRSIGAQRLVEEVERLLDPLRFDGMKVLAVDDNPLVLDTVRTLLEEQGTTVHTLVDPRLFWDVLEEKRPDLLVLDLDMPSVSGIELCLVVRGDPRWVHLPILFLTAHDSPEAIQRVFAAGADDYVAKPIVGPELIARISGRLERVRLYRAMAETDPLTGLANRRRLVEAMDRLTRISERYSNPLSVAVIDLDHFKSVNDEHGHPAGDAVLVGFARLLAGAFRGEDVVARWGGEEFFVALYGAPRDQAAGRLEQVLKQLQALPFQGRDRSFTASFSAGVAEYPSDGDDLHALYQAADQALYRAKEAGRARVYTSTSE